MITTSSFPQPENFPDMEVEFPNIMALEEISESLNVSDYPTLGMSANYDLRRHKFESLANDGAHEMRSDVRRYIGNPSDFGGCNPVNGHIIALTMPMIKPERVKLAGYVYECSSTHLHDFTARLIGVDGFFHDDILEGTNEGVVSTDLRHCFREASLAA